MKIKIRFPKIVVTSFLTVLVLLGCTSSSEPALVDWTIGDQHLTLSPQYIPDYVRRADAHGPSPSLLLEATWPNMAPYKDPPSNTPVHIKHRDVIDMLVRPSQIDLWAEIQRAHLAEGLGTRIAERREFGLVRYSRPANGLLASTRLISSDMDDYFFSESSGAPHTFIRCASHLVPGPSEGSSKLNPRCKQIFHISSSLEIEVGYQRAHLKDWQEIQRRVTSLIGSFIDHSSRNAPNNSFKPKPLRGSA
jgi:hypothetical protein